MEQVKAYFSAVENPPTYSMKPWLTQRDADWDRDRDGSNTSGTGMGQRRDKPWMGQTEDSLIPQVCQLTELKQTKEWERYPNRFRRLYETLLPENLGKHCREWPESEIKLLIEEASKPQDFIV